MSPIQHLVNITRDRKINVLMLEAQEDCSGLITDLSYVFRVLGLAANYQNLKDGFTQDVHLCRDTLTKLSTEHGGLWQMEARDALLVGLDSAIELNRRLQLRHIIRAMRKIL